MEYVVVCGEDEVAGPPEIFVTHYEDAMTATFCLISTGVVYLTALVQMGGTASSFIESCFITLSWFYRGSVRKST